VSFIMAQFFGARPAPGSRVTMCAVTAAAATVLELITPFGLDNLTIPLGTALVAAAVLQ